MPGLMGMKRILALNDEAHHCYREKPAREGDEGPLKGDGRNVRAAGGEDGRGRASAVRFPRDRRGSRHRRPELRFLAALGGSRPNSLFFAGDLGQRIFQTPFSWRALGVDVRGRSHALRINYRTSHQIRRQADRLLPPELADVDGNAEQRGATVSVFNGPAPESTRTGSRASSPRIC